jgi:Bacterial capsule synthesis protein PGA_cap
MTGSYQLALTGDVIMNTRVSACRDQDVLAAVDLLRTADVTHAHLEIPLHDFDGADIFGAAEGAMAWYRGPTAIADELRWMGVNVVSATSSFPAFARAGAARTDAAGRPGVNPLRYFDVIDPATADRLISIVAALGLGVVRDTGSGEFVIHPPGLHNTIWRLRVVEGEDPPTTRCDESDLAGNLESIRYARSVSDLVIAHLHVQAWDGADGRMSSSPAFAHEFGRAAAEAGATVVLVQGAHAPIRGIEVHAGVPILYDPGPLFRLGRREPQPHDFYTRWGNDARVRSFDAGVLDAFGARDAALGGGGGKDGGAAVSADAGGGDPKVTLSPREGYGHEPGFFVPVCAVDAVTHRVTRVYLHPMKWSRASRATTGFPARVTGAAAEAILDRVAELSAPYGTSVSVADGIGWVMVA